ATITFSTGPQGATPPAGIVPPANVSGGAGAGFNLTWTGTANATNTPGTYVWNVLLTDGVSNVNRSVRITIANLAPAHVVVAPTTGTGALATPYAATIQIGSTTAINIATVSDGNTGQNVSFVSQSLTASPAGSSATHTFSVSPASGNPVTLVCTPSAAVLADLGDFDYTILVQDDTSPTPVQSTIYVRITIAGTAPSITSTALTTAAVGISYNYQVTATGNPSTFTFSASGLPAWLSISGTGLISGTPAAGDIGTTGTITVTVANGITPNATQNFSITVAAAVAPAITSTAVTTATEGTAYTYTFTLTGNPTPTLSLTTGTLPAWLTLSGNTLSGTPPAGSAATYGPFTFTATNGVTPDATQTFSIVVSAPSSGGGGGDDGGCSTGNGQSWLMLAGLLAALGVALRTGCGPAHAQGPRLSCTLSLKIQRNKAGAPQGAPAALPFEHGRVTAARMPDCRSCAAAQACKIGLCPTPIHQTSASAPCWQPYWRSSEVSSRPKKPWESWSRSKNRPGPRLAPHY
ncbi:MAG: hypothetical protein DPW14_13315, partial [Planctomycetes bacterium]|nr:hypothetical protein [Planctomycetota bacterium]